MNLINLIKEEIDSFKDNNKKNEIKFNNQLILDLFYGDGVNEVDAVDNVTRDEVINMINNNMWEESNPQRFLDSLLQSKHLKMLTPYPVNELSKMKLFKLKDLNIGFALKDNEYKPHSEIVAVHNNEPNVKGIGEVLMNSAIRNGGCYLDHFDSQKLTGLYSSLGFEEIGRDTYDPQYDTGGEFKNKYGELDVIYRKFKGC